VTDHKEALKKVQEAFGGRTGMLAHMVIEFSMSGQLCDVTFFQKKPAIDVKIDPKISFAVMYGAGAEKLQELLGSISLSDGQVVSLDEIWMIVPMMQERLLPEKLAAVNMADGETVAGPNDETIREMIRALYKCESKEEEDRYLRRYLAS
jgi:hypothetical protein